MQQVTVVAKRELALRAATPGTPQDMARAYVWLLRQRETGAALLSAELDRIAWRRKRGNARRKPACMTVLRSATPGSKAAKCAR